MGKIYQGSGCVVEIGHWFANVEISGKFDESSFDGMMEAKTQLELGENGRRESETIRINYFLRVFQ